MKQISVKGYKNWYDFVEQVIDLGLCQKFKFKWLMHSPESVLENETQDPLWDFEIQTDHLISAKRQHLLIIYKKTNICLKVDLSLPAEQRRKLKESETRDKNLDLAWKLKKTKTTMKHESDGESSCNWHTWNNPQKIGKIPIFRGLDWKTCK